MTTTKKSPEADGLRANSDLLQHSSVNTECKDNAFCENPTHLMKGGAKA